jgi:hypothetical protein
MPCLAEAAAALPTSKLGSCGLECEFDNFNDIIIAKRCCLLLKCNFYSLSGGTSSMVEGALSSKGVDCNATYLHMSCRSSSRYYESKHKNLIKVKKTYINIVSGLVRLIHLQNYTQLRCHPHTRVDLLSIVAMHHGANHQLVHQNSQLTIDKYNCNI